MNKKTMLGRDDLLSLLAEVGTMPEQAGSHGDSYFVGSTAISLTMNPGRLP